MITEYKNGLRRAGVRAPERSSDPVQPSRTYRRVPEERLENRLGLAKYNVPAPLDDVARPAKTVKILLSQHIGAPAVAAVSVGDTVSEGDVVAKAAQGLSVNIHASVSGRVLEVSDRYLVIGPQEAARG